MEIRCPAEHTAPNERAALANASVWRHLGRALIEQ